MADEEELSKDRPISTGPNARPRDETISSTGPGLPDDTSKPVDLSDEEEVRIAEKLKAG